MRTIRYASIAAVVVILLLFGAGGALAASGSLGSELVAAGESHQVMQFNPDASQNYHLWRALRRWSAGSDTGYASGVSGPA